MAHFKIAQLKTIPFKPVFSSLFLKGVCSSLWLQYMKYNYDMF